MTDNPKLRGEVEVELGGRALGMEGGEVSSSLLVLLLLLFFVPPKSPPPPLFTSLHLALLPTAEWGRKENCCYLLLSHLYLTRKRRWRWGLAIPVWGLSVRPGWGEGHHHHCALLLLLLLHIFLGRWSKEGKEKKKLLLLLWTTMRRRWGSLSSSPFPVKTQEEISLGRSSVAGTGAGRSWDVKDVLLSLPSVC